MPHEDLRTRELQSLVVQLRATIENKMASQNITQQALAKTLHVDRATINRKLNRLESASVETLFDLASALGVKLVVELQHAAPATRPHPLKVPSSGRPNVLRVPK
jgi:transcriptional regulator with XRE-family HTH domain